MSNDSIISYDELRALNRSVVKRRILRYLRCSKSKITVLGLSRAVESNYANTYGAIFGDGKKYSMTGSLVTMAMVEVECRNDGSMLCSITPKGIVAADQVKT